MKNSKQQRMSTALVLKREEEEESRTIKHKTLEKLERNQSQTYNQSHTRRPSNKPTSLPRIRKSQDTSIFTISKKHEHEFFLAMLHYNHCYNYLLTFLLSRVIYLHNFIGHVLDSVCVRGCAILSVPPLLPFGFHGPLVVW